MPSSRGDFPNSIASDRDLKNSRFLRLISSAAFLVHGYHPYVEDAEIYVPGIKKLLNPALYPYNQAFYASHAHLSLFSNIVAASARVTHLPIDWVLLAWQFACVFVFLYACWKIGRLVFPDPLAAWGGVALVASLLTIPVAGTALYIMDQYLTARSFSDRDRTDDGGERRQNGATAARASGPC